MIWCVEDDDSIRDIEVYALQSTGLEARGFADGGSFWAALEQEKPALVVLDVMLPGVSGIDLLRRMKASPALREIPVVMATAKGAEYDRIQGLDLGADYYLTKPFGVMELVSCVKAVLRRCGQSTEQARTLSSGGLCVHLDERTVTADGERIALTYKEFELLRLFLSHPGMAFTRDQLFSEIWGMDYCGESRTVDMHIRTLRQKLGRLRRRHHDGARCRLPVGGAGMTRKIFRSIVLVAGTVLLASLLLILGYLYDFFGGVQETQLKDELTLASAAVESTGGDYLAQLSSDRFRLTWIAADGSVLYDTQADASSMESHADREEVQQALKTGEGESTRYSATLLQKTLYYARRLGDGTVLRISVSRATAGRADPRRAAADAAGAGRGIDPLGRSRPAALEADRRPAQPARPRPPAAQRQL